jgi:hypothetical protein
MKYKLIKFIDSYAIQRVSDNTSFTPDLRNIDYQQFIDDIYEKGTEIVEGADIQTEISYTDARVAEYPPIEDQLDKIYHSGINAWKADIKKIKDKYPKTQVGITTTESLPSWIDTVLFDKQKEKYIEAKERLAQRELSAGVVDPISGMHIIEPLPLVVKDENGNDIRNPLVVQDETEREAAQEVINKTPQAVIDSINT